MLKKIGKSFLALAALVVLSTVARAVWDSTTGNMPNSYQLCWGVSNNACIYGSTLSSNFVRIQTAGIDALTINGSQVVTIPGALNVTGAVTVTGNVQATGGQVGLTPNTTFTLLTVVPISTGAEVSVQLFTAGSLGSAFGNCIASGTTIGAWVWPSTSTASPARACL